MAVVAPAAAASLTPRTGVPVSPAAAPVSAATLAPQAACGQATPGTAACLAVIDTGLHWTGSHWTTGAAAAPRPKKAPADTTTATAAAAPAPYMAANLQSAYNLPSALLGARQTIAIVDAFDDPDAASDLAKYRAANNLPACNAANPCFTKVNQDGVQGSYARSNKGWAGEESLDLDMASSICPNCKIILVEADSNAGSNLHAAEREAAKLGPNVISNSWGAPEYPGEQADCSQYFDPSGIAVTASSGDSGFGAGFPALCASVTAVGGTTLTRDPGSGRGWAEGAWQFAGSGCSAYIAKPAWQHDRLCGMRADADVSAVADPDTPVAVYDTFDEPGWVAFGGTSVASPIIAGVYALAGNAATAGPGASYAYAHTRYLNDVTSGIPFYAGGASNGYCGGSYLCTAGPGYDGPTGLGTPDGTGGF
jgi:subtilase family serine protease